MKVYTSEVEMLRAQYKEWEKVCNSHLRLIKKLKKQRTWVGLTDSEIGTIAYNVNPLDGIRQFSRAIEAKLKEKNT